jgi:hypothetical protein
MTCLGGISNVTNSATLGGIRHMTNLVLRLALPATLISHLRN